MNDWSELLGILNASEMTSSDCRRGLHLARALYVGVLEGESSVPSWAPPGFGRLGLQRLLASLSEFFDFELELGCDWGVT